MTPWPRLCSDDQVILSLRCPFFYLLSFSLKPRLLLLLLFYTLGSFLVGVRSC